MNNPKVRVKIGDGFEFLRKCSQRAKAVKAGEVIQDWWDSDIPRDGKFDIIITDNSQMEDFGQINDALYSEEYFKNIQQALRPPQGILSSLGT